MNFTLSRIMSHRCCTSSRMVALPSTIPASLSSLATGITNSDITSSPLCYRAASSSSSSSSLLSLNNCSNNSILSQKMTLVRDFRSSRRRRQHRGYHESAILDTKAVTIIYVDPTGEEFEANAEVGKNLLDVAHDNNIELEGACGGELACATCHLVFDEEMFDTLDEKDPEEDDMLDLAFELTDTSRLGCQIRIREDMAGMKVKIPDDGY